MRTIPKPMLAVPMHKGTINSWTEWAIEEKFDGHRVVVMVTPTDVAAYKRPRHGKEMPRVTLPAHLDTVLRTMPCGVYDGELMGGDTSTDVVRLDLAGLLVFRVFDILEHDGTYVGAMSYDERRRLLVSIFKLCRPAAAVTLAESFFVSSQKDVTTFTKRVWDRGGEGAIIKHRTSPYQQGKRSTFWIKVKKCGHEVMTVVGFEPSRGTVRFPGHPFAIVVLEDAKGHHTTVKTKDDHELKKFEEEWTNAHRRGTDDPNKLHPALGRKLMIEYQDRTRDGGYRHPRWDRWDTE